ncbi:MAG: TIGR02186 family protein, partial [Thermodesulfobacteriota bacterium]
MKTILAVWSVLAILAVLLTTPLATAEEMITETTKHNIQVGVRFSGEMIYFFGTVADPEAEVVVKLYSQDSPPLKLMRKGRMVLFWMGLKQFEVENLP